MAQATSEGLMTKQLIIDTKAAAALAVAVYVFFAVEAIRAAEHPQPMRFLIPRIGGIAYTFFILFFLEITRRTVSVVEKLAALATAAAFVPPLARLATAGLHIPVAWAIRSYVTEAAITSLAALAVIIRAAELFGGSRNRPLADNDG